MARRRLDEALYDALKTAYLERPGNHSHAASMAGCSRATAKTAWLKGWRLPFAVPLRDAVTQAHETARALRFTEEAKVARTHAVELVQGAEEDAKSRLEAFRRHAELDAAQQLLGEAMVARHALSNAGSLAEVVSLAVAHAIRLITHVDEGELDGFNAKQRMGWVRATAELARQSAESSRQALELERMRNREPTQIVGLELPVMTEERAASLILQAKNMLALVQRPRPPILEGETSQP